VCESGIQTCAPKLRKITVLTGTILGQFSGILFVIREIDSVDIWIDPDPGQRADVMDLSLYTLLLSILSSTLVKIDQSQYDGCEKTEHNAPSRSVKKSGKVFLILCAHPELV